jgi:ABC transport system ATP-binding/permease protein
VDDWLTQSRRSAALTPKAVAASTAPPSAAAAPSTPPKPKAKLSYKDQRELDALPGQIEELEAEQAALRAELAEPSLYTDQPDRATKLLARDAQIETDLTTALERWEILSQSIT